MAANHRVKNPKVIVIDPLQSRDSGSFLLLAEGQTQGLRDLHWDYERSKIIPKISVEKRW